MSRYNKPHLTFKQQLELLKSRGLEVTNDNIPDWQIMESWLRSLNYVRNVVAHHSRLWNRNLIDFMGH